MDHVQVPESSAQLCRGSSGERVCSPRGQTGRRGTLVSGWADRRGQTNILSAQEFGVIKARTAKRRPETLKWDRELYEAINVVSWLIDGPLQDRKLAGHQHPGCKACDGETSGVRHRGRPFNHSPECSTRQPDFRERLREMKMLSAHEASSVMEPAAGSSRLRRNGKPNGQRWFAWKSLRRRKTSTEIKPVDLC